MKELVVLWIRVWIDREGRNDEHITTARQGLCFQRSALA